MATTAATQTSTGVFLCEREGGDAKGGSRMWERGGGLTVQGWGNLEAPRGWRSQAAQGWRVQWRSLQAHSKGQMLEWSLEGP